MAQGPLDQVVLSGNFMTIITEDKQILKKWTNKF